MQREVKLPDGKGVLLIRDDHVQSLIREFLERAFFRDTDGTRGGVINHPDKWGLTGEGGPEAILPRKPSHPGLAENPKDAIGKAKPGMSALPVPPLYEAALGCTEGSFKYARHNYRVAKIRASIYYDAAKRHIDWWWEGQDIDPDSGIHHIGKAISCLLVLRDAQMNDKVIDDRPPIPAEFLTKLQEQMDAIVARHPNPLAPFTQKGLDREAQRGILEEDEGQNPT